MDRRWARRAQCPRAQQYSRSARALNGRRHCMGGGPGIHAGEDVHAGMDAVLLWGSAALVLVRGLSSTRCGALRWGQMVLVSPLLRAAVWVAARNGRGA